MSRDSMRYIWQRSELPLPHCLCRCDGFTKGAAVVPPSRVHLRQALFAGPVTVADALAWHVDLLSPVSKPALQGLLALAQGQDREKLGQIVNGSAEQYKAWHKQSRCLLEVLEEFPNIQPPLGTPKPTLTNKHLACFQALSAECHSTSINLVILHICIIMTHHARYALAAEHENLAEDWSGIGSHGV